MSNPQQPPSQQQPQDLGFIDTLKQQAGNHDFWQNLMNFGASTLVAANQRTPQGFLANGTGPMGPIGAGILGAQEQAQRRELLGSRAAETTARTGLYGAEAKKAQVEAQLAQQRLDMLNDPKFREEYMGAGPSQSTNTNFAAPTLSSGQPSGSGGQPSGDASTGAWNSIGDQGIRGLAQRAVQTVGLPPEAVPYWVSALHNESGWNPNIPNSKKGAVGIGQVMPKLWGPHFGVTEQDLHNPAINLPVSASIFKQGWEKGGGDPRKALASYYGADDSAYYGPILGRVQRWGGGATRAQAPTQQPESDEQATIQHFGQLSDHFDRQARTLALAGFTEASTQAAQKARMYGEAALAGPKAALTKSAEFKFELARDNNRILREAEAQGRGPQGQSIPGSVTDPKYLGQSEHEKGMGSLIPNIVKERAKPFSLRGRASVYGQEPVDIDTGYGHLHLPGTRVQTPDVFKVEEPNTGAEFDVGVPTLAAPGQEGKSETKHTQFGDIQVPAGSGAPVLTKQPTGMEHLITGAASNYTQEGKKQYDSATLVNNWATQMEAAADRLNVGGGWSATGPTNQWRMEAANLANDMFNVFGLKPAFDTDKVASWADLAKLTKTAGLQLNNSIWGASREAANVVNIGLSSIPSNVNPERAFHMIMDNIKETAQNRKDEYAFQTNWLLDPKHGGNPLGADLAFKQMYPAEKYAYRAISKSRPYRVDTLEDAQKKYLPGTVVNIPRPDGTRRDAIVPGPYEIPLAQTQMIQPTPDTQ